MVMTNDMVSHQGKVERVENHKVFVRFEQKASCSDCQSVAVCPAAKGKDNIVEVSDFTGDFAPNDEVILSGRQSMGRLAVVFAFVIPLITIISAVVCGILLSGSEAIGGLAGLLTLFPYYFILYLLRHKISKKFVFTLSKSPTSIA